MFLWTDYAYESLKTGSMSPGFSLPMHIHIFHAVDFTELTRDSLQEPYVTMKTTLMAFCFQYQAAEEVGTSVQPSETLVHWLIAALHGAVRDGVPMLCETGSSSHWLVPWVVLWGTELELSWGENVAFIQALWEVEMSQSPLSFTHKKLSCSLGLKTCFHPFQPPETSESTSSTFLLA